ncbi:MAG: trypsin-like peptidase domain-containing protein [Bryobacteraceae bacterium]|jgi:serine protease Do
MWGFGAIAERLRRSTVEIYPGQRGRTQGHGSGIVWNSGGSIVTNSHVARSDRVDVVLWDGRRVSGRVTRRDPFRDLAAIAIAADSLEPAGAADSAALRPGELAMAIGSPLGFAGALSTGVIHSLGPVAGMGPHHWVRADVRLAPGNSGGPLANAEGLVIGVNTAVYNGLGLAVPSNDVADFLGRGTRPMLGVTLNPAPLGLLILEIDGDGPAALAGLKQGDVLLMTYQELSAALDSGAGVVALRFLRGGSASGRLPIRETHVRLAVRAEAA